MKKQIFKLTSILLAMVMVFTMFTMIPISAEETTVDLATAADDLETAWQNLDYAGYKHSQWVNYIGGWLNDTSRAEYAATSAPDYAPSTHNYTFTVNSTSKQFMWGNQTNSGGMETFKMFDELKANIEDMYFYYRSTGDVTVRVVSVLNNGVDADLTTNDEWASRDFTSSQVIESTNGVWKKFSWNEFLTNKVGGNTVQSAFHSGGFADWAYFLRLGFVILADSDVEFSVGDLFAEVNDYDKNLVGCEDWSDADWYDKAVSVDENALKADYRDAADSETWLAFTSALEAVRACEEEYAEAKLRDAAEEMITSVESYAYPIQQGRTDYSSLMTATNSTVSEFGSYYRELTLPNYGKAIDAAIGANSIWLQTKFVGANDNLRFGDMGTNPYIFVEVSSTGTADVAHLGFFGRMLVSGTQKDLTSSYTAEVKAGNTYKIYIGDILEGFGSDFANWETDTKSTGNIYGGLFVMGATDAEVTLKVGSVVSETNYEITSTKTGTEFVAEMAALDISSFGNTAPFLAALEAALDAFPEVEELVVVENLRVAAGKMVESTTSFLYPANKNGDGVLTLNATTDTDRLVYGDYTTNHPFEVVSTIYRGNGIWFAPDTTSGGRTVKYIGEYADAYLTVRVESAAAGAKLGFWMRTIGSVGSQYDIASNHTVAVESGQTYTIPMAYFFDNMAHTNADYNEIINGWREYSLSTATTNQFGATLFCLVATGAVTATVGSIIETENYVPSSATGIDFVAEMAVLDTSSFYNTEEFEAALEAALEVFPEIEAEVELANTVRDLKNTWKNLTYIPHQMNTAPLRAYSTGGSQTQNNIFVDGNDASKEYLTSADGVGTAYLFPVDDYKDSNGDSTPNETFVWGNVGSNIFLKEDMESVGIWYKSSATISQIRVIAQFSTNLTTNGGVLPATDGWEFITFKEIMPEASWNSFLSNANFSNITDLRLMFTNSTARSTEIYFGDMVVYGKDKQIEGIDTWSNEELAINADKANLDVYEDDDVLKEQFATLTAKLKEIYAANFAAQDVIDAANKLGGLGLKPSTLIEHDQFDEEGVWAGAGASYSANTNYLSNNGDQYVTINTEDFGNPSCAPQSGAVQYEAVADGGIKLADIDDIFFSYKIENFVPGENGSVAARIWFFDERYAFYEEDEDGNIVKDEDGNVNVIKDNWACDMATHGTTRYFAVNGKTDGWATTSLATIFGSDWKTNYVKYLNGDLGIGNNLTDAEGNAYSGTITADNTYITKLALGFNGYNIEGDYADVTLGSMYVDYADDRFAIDADVADPEAVLAEALTIDASGCKKADADAFKKAVKALADALEENISAANCVAGNNAVTLVDLSLLARYVDAADKDAFVAANYIDLTAADINGDDVINEADVTALRLAMLTPAED